MKLRVKLSVWPARLFFKALRCSLMASKAMGGGLGLKARWQIVRDTYRNTSQSARLIGDFSALARLQDGRRAATRRGHKKQLMRAERAWADHVDWMAEEGQLTDEQIDAGGPEMPVCLLENGAC